MAGRAPAGGHVTGQYRSPVPGAIDDLVATLRQRIDLNPPQRRTLIHDGSFVQGGTEHDKIVVGWSGFIPGYEYPSKAMSEHTGGAVASGESDWMGLGPGIMENFQIHCITMAWTGSATGKADVSIIRRRAYDLVNLAGSLIAVPWLGGTVMKAEMAKSTELHVAQQRGGLLAAVTFSIACSAMAQQ